LCRNSSFVIGSSFVIRFSLPDGPLEAQSAARRLAVVWLGGCETAGSMLAGGGMKTGQVIGATDRWGGEPAERPVTFGEVFATLYHNLGIDAGKATITDLAGRPQYLVEAGSAPMKELV